MLPQKSLGATSLSDDACLMLIVFCYRHLRVLR